VGLSLLQYERLISIEEIVICVQRYYKPLIFDYVSETPLQESLDKITYTSDGIPTYLFYLANQNIPYPCCQITDVEWFFNYIV
jgi:hypothetical protein